MKKILPLFALSIAVVSLVAVGTQNSAIRTDASVNPYVIVKDDFNDSKYKGTINDSIWTSKTTSANAIHQSLTNDCYLDNNTAQRNVETSAFVTNRVVNGIKSFQFDMKYDDTTITSGKWMSVYFANQYQDMFSGAALAYAGLMRTGYNAIFNAGSSFDKENFNFAACLGSGVNLVSNWLTIKITIDGPVSGSINACIQGESFVDANKVSFTYNKGVDLQNCYVGLSVSNEAGEVKIDNLSLVNSGLSLDEDFSHCDPTDPESNYIYKVSETHSGDLSYNTFTVIDNGSLELNDASANDYIYSNKAVEDPETTVDDIDVVDLSFKTKINKAGYKIGIVFGYDYLTDNIFKNTTVYEISRSGGRLYEYDDDGNQILAEDGNINYFNKIKDGSIIDIKVNKKNGVSVTEDGISVLYGGKTVPFSKVTHYLGSVAIVLLEKGTATPAICFIDQFKLATSTYYIPVTKSVTHNFSNNYWGNKAKPDFFVRDPNGAGKQSVKNGRLVWSMASDGTFFGSAHQYDNFILDFKLMSIYGDNTVESSTAITAKNKWIGLDLSRDIVDRSTYSSYVNIFTYITPEEGMTDLVKVDCDSLSPIKNYEVERKNFNAVSPSLFANITYNDEAAKENIKEADAVCFRYVSEGGNLTMYLKKNSDVNYTKIVTFYNLQLKGYFALCCTGWTFLELDDFSMSNTSPVYICADNDVPETIIEIVTKIIYDNQNNPINWDKELKVNSQYNLYIALIATFASTTVLALGGIATILIIKKKKGNGIKHEENR